MGQIDTIIWDWNGTLFDDVVLCIESINQLLSDRKLNTLDRESYLNLFDFPVQDYYQRIGFDFKKEPFKVPANQFINLYHSKIQKAPLHQSAKTILAYFANKNYQQFVLSAAEESKLKELLRDFGIYHYFNQVVGLDHNYATSKIDLGIQLLKTNDIKASTCCLIGDTIHDFEVAQALGCQCILIANGHHAIDKLKSTGAIIIHELKELVNYL
jgi:phosphoglycolate phosphatase